MNGAYLVILLNFTVLSHEGTSNIKQANFISVNLFILQTQSTKLNGTFHAHPNTRPK